MASQQQYVVWRAAGAELDQDWPSLDAAQAALDAALDADAEGVNPDRELLELLGVA